MEPWWQYMETAHKLCKLGLSIKLKLILVQLSLEHHVHVSVPQLLVTHATQGHNLSTST